MPHVKQMIVDVAVPNFAKVIDDVLVLVTKEIRDGVAGFLLEFHYFHQERPDESTGGLNFAPSTASKIRNGSRAFFRSASPSVDGGGSLS